jgi:myo-inositol-1(or 4)-monophosphatase
VAHAANVSHDSITHVTDANAAAPTPHPTELLDLALALATEAAAMLVDGLGRVRASVETKSTVTDMVTEMDRASEQLIVAGILAARPGDGITGEEGTERPGSSGVRWIIDPVDGTTNYLYGLPGFAVSIAAELAGRGVVAGAVVDPLHGDTYTATAGGGSFRNGVGLSGSTETRLGHALVATGFSYDARRRARQAAVLHEVLPRVRDIRRFGAAAVDLCAVGAGRVDAFYEKGLAPWDYAAGALVAQEAGMVVGDLDGRPTSTTFTLAAPAALFEPLADLLRGAGANDA